MKFSIVLSTQQTVFQAATLSGSLETNMKQIADFGYDGVELAIRDPKLVDADELALLIKKYNLVVPAIGTGQAWGEEGLSFADPEPSIRRKAIERIISHVEIADRFNAIIIIGLIRGLIKPGMDQARGMSLVCEALQECSEAASSHGVRLALEPINRYETSLINSVPEGLALIEQVGYDNFGLLLDTFHMNIEETNIEESIRNCADRIFHFHVADSNRWYPGAGHLDFSAILNSLNGTGYEGFVSGEFIAKPDAMTAAQAGINHLRSII